MSEIANMNDANGAVATASGSVSTADTVSLVAWANEMAAAGQLARALCETQFVPENFRNKEGDTAAAIMMGKSLGMDPLNSLQNLFVVRGRPGMYARVMHSLVLRAGHEVYRSSATEQAVTVRARRRGDTHWQEFTWTLDRAKRAGYDNNAKYRTDPQAMLTAKALAEACRTIAPDVLTGVAATTVEEIQLGDYDDAEIVSSEETPTVSQPKKTTVKRKVTTRAKAPEPSVPDVSDTPDPEPVEETAEGTEPAGEEPGDAAVKSSKSTKSQWDLAAKLMRDIGVTEKSDMSSELNLWAKDNGITRELPSMAALSSEECSRFINYLEQLVNPTSGNEDAGEDGQQSWQTADVPE